MAGKRQHYLPQFLQRGFTSASSSRTTWLYRKNAAPREVGLRDVGVEENFYSVESDSSVDETITEIERGEFVGIIEHARAGIFSDSEAASLVPRLIAHLEVRSRHLRMNLTEMSERAWNDGLGNFEDSALGAALLRAHMKRNPGDLRSMAARELQSKGLPAHMAPTLAKQMVNMVSAMSDQVLIASFWTPLLPHLRAAFETRIRPSIKQAHLDALAKSVAPDVRAEQYRHLRFTLVDVASNDLILGDAAVLFRVDAPPYWRPFLDKRDELLALYLPLSPARVLVGSLDEPAIEPKIVRQQIARTSKTFFVSSQPSPANVELSKEIGIAAQPLSEEELHSIRRQIISEELL